MPMCVERLMQQVSWKRAEGVVAQALWKQDPCATQQLQHVGWPLSSCFGILFIQVKQPTNLSLTPFKNNSFPHHLSL
ncbi:conserved hypothetical protein [Ricinus communis]|uniref:Uncharacterized protein n=1 Tax=Ricinus communis TaxID=3988 RepID=B9SF68_RICCO|nr:conserved hypothetical protein [Ricinus communis]